MEGLSCNKRVWHDSDELNLYSPEVKRLKEDLLNTKDDSDICTSHDLDSFIKSFENEILDLSPVAARVVVSGESQPDLGFLLEASDDELGLPPSASSLKKEAEVELARVTVNSPELSELWRFETEVPSGNDPFDPVFGESVTIDGLFEYSDTGFGSADDFVQPNTLPAL